MNHKERKENNFRFRDFIVILLCLSGAAVSLYLFRLDLFRTIDSQNKEPIGIVIVKNNIVQRRLADRVLWERLFVDSSAYAGDMIRVANLSDATLFIDNKQIDLDENTLIRIQRSQNDKIPFQVELHEGTLNLAAGAEGGNIMLLIKDIQVEAGPGTVLNAAAGKDGMMLQVSEGRATFIDGDQRRDIAAGTMVAMDAGGMERIEPAAVVTRPQLNARYLKNTVEPLSIDFAWSRINLEAGEFLRLEIAEDRNFSGIARVADGLDTSAAAALGTGLWYWRLLREDAVLAAGRFTIVDALGPVLVSPAADSLFRYQDALPRINFQWADAAEASSYVLEVGETPSFTNPRISRQLSTTSFTDSNLGPGTWYWRVMPVFPSVYEGSAAYSPAVSFRIEWGDELEEPPPAVIEEEIPVPSPQPPLPLLPAPENRLPGNGYRVGIEQLEAQRNIVFGWSAVPGANAYIFILYEQRANGRRQIIRSAPENRTSWTLDNLGLLDRGTFVWQVEAVSRGRDGTIERRGNIGENSFVVDVPLPSQPELRIEEIQTEGTGH